MAAELSQVRVFLIVFMSMKVRVQACPYGWFGRGCNFQCHCYSSVTCAMDGKCPGNSPCRSPYFGPACQYVDLLLTDVDPSTPMYVRDNKRSTCNPNSGARSVQLLLLKALPFTWYRVVVNNNSSLLDIKTTVNNGTSCSRQFIYGVDTKSVDVWCQTDALVNNITIGGAVAASICSVHVSGGRNVALKQRTSQSSTYPSHHISRVQAANAVDGNTNPDDLQFSCSRTNEQRDMPYWDVSFNRSYRLPRIFIYTQDNSTRPSHLFILETYGVYNNRTSLYQVSTRVSPIVDVIVETWEPVGRIKITQIDTQSAVYLSLVLCEVQAMGEAACPLNTHGLECEAACRCDPDVRCSITTGACALAGPRHTCPRGTYGETCSTPCSLHCQYGQCNSQTGQCIGCIPGYMGSHCDQACSPGTYGIACKLDCSEGCISICSNTIGTCTCKPRFRGDLCLECMRGLFGENCTQRCPEFCRENHCERLNGRCNECVGKRVGQFCEACPVGYHGAACNQTCPTNCKFRQCDADTGQCNACETGFNGTHCTQALTVHQMHPVLLLSLVFPCMLLVVWWFVGQGRADSFLSLSE